MSLVLTLAALYLGIAALVYAFQRTFIYFPDAQRPAIDRPAPPALREVELATSDGLSLLTWYLPPPAGGPVVLFFHGNAGSIQDRTWRVAAFANAGYGVLMPEYRGYGGNPGTPSETGFLADANTAMDFLRTNGVEAGRVVVYGESLGTGVAVDVAATHAVAALVLESPYTNLAAIAARRFNFLPVNLMLKDRFDSLARIGRVQAPLLILQGDSDSIVPAALGKALFDAAREPKTLWTAPGGGHNDLSEHGADKAVLNFLDRYVPQ